MPAVRLSSSEKPRVETVLLVQERDGGALFAKNVPDGGTVPKGTPGAAFPEGVPVIVTLSDRNHSTIKAQGETGMVFQNLDAFQRWEIS